MESKITDKNDFKASTIMDTTEQAGIRENNGMPSNSSTEKKHLASVEIKAKIDFLDEQIDKRIKTFDRLRTANRQEAMFLRLLTTILGSAIAVVAGLKLPDQHPNFVANFALIVGGIITVVNAWDALRDPSPLWVKYTVTSSELRSLWSDLDYLKKRDISKIKIEEIDHLYERYKIILNETNKAWQKTRNDEKEKSTVESQ